MLKLWNLLRKPATNGLVRFNSYPAAAPAVQADWRPSREVWLESMDAVEADHSGIVKLDNAIFGASPRIDIVHQNIEWQRKYRFVSFAHTKTRNEVRGGGRKPWPQKGLGRARHGSIRSPLWRGGGIAHGPRSPTTHFYMLPFYNRVLGLVSTLSIKLAQDDLHVVKNLEIPTEDPQYLHDLIAARQWGPSVLFVDASDVLSKNISISAENIDHVNLMPTYGLNVYSMLKHNTVVLTEDAVRDVERKLLEHLNRNNARAQMSKFKYDK